MPELFELSRRERQIMDAVFALGAATVNEVVDAISSPPTPMAVRRMMRYWRGGALSGLSPRRRSSWSTGIL